MALADTLQSMQEFDLADLDFDSIGSWPLAIKIIIVLILFAALVFGGYSYLIEDMENQLVQGQTHRSWPMRISGANNGRKPQRVTWKAAKRFAHS